MTIPDQPAINVGDTVVVHHEAGDEIGTVLSIRDMGYGAIQVDCHMDDDTYCWFPASQVAVLTWTPPEVAR